MRWRFCYIAILFASIIARASFRNRVVADDAIGAPAATIRDGEAGVLLLQDGGVLVGQITRAADWYIVARGGGQMQIAASRMQFVGRSLHEAYEHRLRHTTQPTAESHLALSEWCLRYNLVDEATVEAEAAKSLGAAQGRLQLVGRRIAAAKRRLADKPAVTPAAPSQMAAAEQAAPPPNASRDLPNGALELFTRKVQPILVNNCTASKCHQPGGQQAFQLNRAVLRGEANRQTTTQNLYAALALVDRARPEASPLLTLPRRTHGGMNGPIFGARQEKALQHLADWVALVAPIKPADTTIPNVPAKGVEDASFNTPVPNVPSQTNVADAGENSGVQPAVAIESQPGESLRSPHRLRYGEALQPWQPRDPFDPEIFNRRQQPKK
jgi:hypothetical protein